MKRHIKGFFRWVVQVIRGDIVLIDYYPDPDEMTYTKSVSISEIKAKDAYHLGYSKGVKMLDELKYLPFKAYVRFNWTEPVAFPTETIGDDGKPYYLLETSSSVYDRFKTKSTEKFVKGMTKASLTGGDQKRLIMIVAIALIAVLGMAFIFLR